MPTHAIARLEVDRDTIINNIKVREHLIEVQKRDLLEDMKVLNLHREALKEVEEALVKLQS